MCLIIINRTGNIPKKQFISAYNYNPHGVGIMYNDGEKVHVYKTFNVLIAYDYYLEIKNNNPSQVVVIHFRLASAGVIDVQNIHPLKIRDNVYIMHNGHFDIPIFNPKKSDTWHVARYLKSLSIETIKQMSFGYNRVVIMTKNELLQFGNFITISGNDYSNSCIFNIKNNNTFLFY